jgi:hypothetical protein
MQGRIFFERRFFSSFGFNVSYVVNNPSEIEVADNSLYPGFFNFASDHPIGSNLQVTRFILNQHANPVDL